LFEEIAKLKKIVGGVEAEHVVQYIMENPGTTADKVAKQLRKDKVCSRLTTLKVIDTLVAIGMLIDRRERKYFHRLYYNENYDFTEYGTDLLIRSLDEVEKAYDVLSKDAEHSKMFHELKGYVVKTKLAKLKDTRKRGEDHKKGVEDHFIIKKK
jgi:predicted transcriptional regulator